MKTSNKIIALIFGLLILIPALVVATIIIKYRTGNFTRLDMKSDRITRTFPGIDTITLRDLGVLHIVPSDSLYIETTNYKYADAVNFSVQGSSLLISPVRSSSGTDSIAKAGEGNGKAYSRFGNAVWLHLPAHYTPRIENCAVILSSKSRAMAEETVNLRIINSSISDSDTDSAQNQFRKLRIWGDQSFVDFSTGLVTGEMELDLKNNSRLNIYRSHIGNLLLSVDSSSTVQLSGQQINSVIKKP